MTDMTNNVFYDLKCCHMSDGCGTDCQYPHFSWKVFPGALPGIKQAAYEIQILTVEGETVWDSDYRSGDSCFAVLCPIDLRSHCKLMWRVRIWDELGNESAWSPCMTIITGLTPADWKADWITYDGVSSILPFRDHVWIRKKFSISSHPASAILYLAILGCYDIYINGQKFTDTVMNSQRGCTQEGRLHANYFTYDITSALRNGENVIGIAMDAGTTRTENYLISAIRCQLEIDDLTVCSDKSWLCTANGNQYPGGYRWGDYGSEITVFPSEYAEWSRIDFDDSSWAHMKVADIDCPIHEAISERNAVNEILHPIRITGTDPSVADMGVNFSGWVALKLPPLVNPVIIEVSDKENIPCAFHQKIIYSPGMEEGGWYHSQFNFVSGRYLTIHGLPAPIGSEEIKVCVIGTNLRRTGFFRCSNDLFNRIYETDLRTFRANTVDGITYDCPHRERLGYGETGFSTTLPIGILNYDSASFYSGYLRSWCRTQRDDGYFGHTAPDIPGGGGTAWSSYPVNGCLDYCRFFGDYSLADELMPYFVKWLDFLKSWQGDDGLLRRYENGEWDFLGDWATPDGNDWCYSENAVFFNNCCYAYTLLSCIEMAEKTGRAALAEQLRIRHRKLSDAVTGRYFREGFYFSRDARYQAAALMAEIVPAEIHSTIYDSMLRIIREKGYLDGGSAGGTFLLRVLMQTRDGQNEVYRWMNKTDFPSYGNFIYSGETTWPEMWDMRDIYGASRIHTCYTGCALWFVCGLSGMNVRGTNLYLNPIFPEEMNELECSIDTVSGKFSIEWHRVQDSIEVQVGVPFSAKCEADFGGQHFILEAGKHTLQLSDN